MKSKAINFRNFAQAWSILAILILALAGVTILSVHFYEKNENLYLKAKSEKTAKAIAHNLSTEIQNRVAILNVLGKNPNGSLLLKLEDVALLVSAEYPGFFAINWVDQNGIIKEVHPSGPNVGALGQNLLKRDDVKEFLHAARDEKKTYMSHKLMTYQKVPAFVLYSPMYSEKGVFLGWLNGVVDFDTWLSQYLRSNGLDNVRVVVKWDEPTSQVVDKGNPNAKDFFPFTVQILNQNIDFQIAFSPDKFDVLKNKYYQLVFVVVLVLLALAFIALILLNIVKIKLQRTNETLLLKNRLISTLCHDLSNPLSVLEMATDGDGASSLDEKAQFMISRSIASMKDMLTSVKSLHAHDLGTLKINTVPIKLSDILGELEATFKPQAARKDVKIVVAPIPNDWSVLADPPTLSNNVLLNVMTNAIKFSPTKGTIAIRAEQVSGEIHLIFEDEGKGMSSDQLQSFLKLGQANTTLGTHGEQGTGLGLMQIFGFMKGYGGRVEAETAANGHFQFTLIFIAGKTQ